EKPFERLPRAGGGAGGEKKKGGGLSQTHKKKNSALKTARKKNYENFYDHEINFRRNMHYPPFVALINALVKHQDFAKAAFASSELARLLREADSEKVLKVLGPAHAPLARLKGEHRMQVLIKTKYRRQAREALDAAMAELKEIGQDLKMITVEVDPVNLM